jgi:thioredoxin reductase (NADPH)
MLTPDEVATVRVFAGLALEDRERICRAAADITLAAGEFAAHPGSDGALFAVLAGHIEAVRFADGVGTKVGDRVPGDLFGEVPIVLGTVFPVGFRASEPTRVLRLDPSEYHAVASSHPEVGREVGKLAAHRIGGSRGLQGLAAEPPPPRAIVVGHRWDASCGALRRFLDRNQITFRWLVPDEPDAAEHWGGPVPADADLPAIRVVDGKTVFRPQFQRVAGLLGLHTEADHAEYDVVVVGAGPAGLAAAVYGASEGLRTIVIEREAPGGQAGTSSRIENYLGFPAGVSGDELASRALRQAWRLGAEVLVTRTITRLDTETRQVHLDGGDVLRAKTIVLACGVDWRQLTTHGFERLAGKGIAYGAARSEAASVHGLDIHILGAGNSAGQAAMFFSTHARSVTIVCRGESLERSMSRYLVDQIAARPNIRTLVGTEIVAAHGDASLEAVEVLARATGETTTLESGGLFVFIGADAQTGWLPEEIVRDARGYVLTGPDAHATGRWGLERDPYLLETCVPGVFACGDVRASPVKRVAAAVGEGSMTIAFAHQYLATLATEPTTA